MSILGIGMIMIMNMINIVIERRHLDVHLDLVLALALLARQCVYQWLLIIIVTVIVSLMLAVVIVAHGSDFDAWYRGMRVDRDIRGREGAMGHGFLLGLIHDHARRDVALGRRHGDRGSVVGKGGEVDTEVRARWSHRRGDRRAVCDLKLEGSRGIDKGDSWIESGVGEHKLGVVDGQMRVARAVETQWGVRLWWRQPVEIEVRVTMAHLLRVSGLDFGNGLGWKVAFDLGIEINCRGTVIRWQLGVEPARVAVDMEQTQRQLTLLSSLYGIITDSKLLHCRVKGLSQFDYHGRLFFFFFLDSHPWQATGSLVTNVAASSSMWKSRVKVRGNWSFIIRAMWTVVFGMPFRDALRVQAVLKLVRVVP
jgi:hypothetical protein